MNEKIICEAFVNKNTRIIVLDRLGEEPKFGKFECARNVFMINDNGDVIWQVNSDFDNEGNPFTSVKIDADGRLMAYRWDGGNYYIDVNTGLASPSSEFLK